MDISLIKDENILNEVELRKSYIPFIPKSKFALTNKRVLGEYINVLLWIIPIGKNLVTYPLNQVSGVRIDTKFELKEFIIGLIVTFVGFIFLGSGFTGFSFITLMFIIIGIIIIALGIIGIIGSFKALLVIQSSAGAAMPLQVIKADKNKAMEFVNSVNNALAERS